MSEHASWCASRATVTLPVGQYTIATHATPGPCNCYVREQCIRCGRRSYETVHSDSNAPSHHRFQRRG